jgi:hydrogenase maturation factor
MAVVRIDERRGLALCAETDGSRHTVETALVEPVAAGDVVLVHAGVAIAALAGGVPAQEASAPEGPAQGASVQGVPAQEVPA